MFDCHIHMRTLESDRGLFEQRLQDSGITHAMIFSLPPHGFSRKYPVCTNNERLELLMDFCSGKEHLYPFYWINPLEPDAAEQVSAALAAGVSGFKIICSDFFPSHAAAMEIYKLIACNNKPVLFHTGILWDGKVSSKFCHPIEYECLLEVPQLRFTLAHVSWPWFDTAIAVYGKFLNAQITGNASCEMFIDTTPGTPEIYRREVLTKLYTIGYDIFDNILFGSDSNTANYNVEWVRQWTSLDRRILTDLNIDKMLQDKYLTENALRFIKGQKSNKNIPIAGV